VPTRNVQDILLQKGSKMRYSGVRIEKTRVISPSVRHVSFLPVHLSQLAENFPCISDYVSRFLK
jgi:hypothetical protein